MGDKIFGESDVPWMKDEISTQSTTIPEIVATETHQITIVVIFVISAVLVISLLFVIAIFIDCRQEKLKKLQCQPKRRKVLKLRLPVPKMVRTVAEDENTIIDKMAASGSEPSPPIVIV